MKGLNRFVKLSAVVGALFAGAVGAQQSQLFTNPDLNRDYNYNYQELNNIDPSVQTLTSDLFGDTIDPGSGSLRFSQTDVSLPGNFGLPVSVTRTLSDPSGWHRENRLFGNWSIDIPHIRSSFVTRGRGILNNAYWPVGEACSRQLNSNPDYADSTTTYALPIQDVQGYYLHKDDYWNGDTASIPGQGSATFLAQSGSTKRYNNQNWDVSCWDIPGQSHEGFKIVTGDGTQYFFGQQLIRKEPERVSMLPVPRTQCGTDDCMISLNPDGGSVEFTLIKYQMYMLVTKVVDKFGNEVNYTYSQGSGAIQADRITDTDPDIRRVSRVSAPVMVVRLI